MILRSRISPLLVVGCGLLILWEGVSETDSTVWSSHGGNSDNGGCTALVPAGGVWRGRHR